MFWDTLANFIDVASTVTDVVGKLQESKAAVKAAQFNKNIARYNAAQTRKMGALEEDRSRRDARRRIGLLRANIGASGLAGGTADDILAESMFEAELDALTVRYNYNSQAAAYEMQGQLYGEQAKDSRKAGYVGAAASLLRGVSSLYKNNTNYGAGNTPFKLGGGGGDYSMYNDGTVIKWN